MSEALKATEALGADGATHPRVKLEDIEAAIDAVAYVSADVAVDAQGADMPSHIWARLEMMTCCFVVMKNGFIVIGKSAPASPENFDREKGKVFAYEDAIRQLWPLMGYALRDKLYSGPDPEPAEVVDHDGEDQS